MLESAVTESLCVLLFHESETATFRGNGGNKLNLLQRAWFWRKRILFHMDVFGRCNYFITFYGNWFATVPLCSIAIATYRYVRIINMYCNTALRAPGTVLVVLVKAKL